MAGTRAGVRLAKSCGSVKIEIDGITWTRVPTKISLENHLEEFKLNLLPHVKPEWASKELISKPFDTGTTNTLFAISERDRGLTEDTVLLRVNGKGTKNLISRQDEIVATVALHRNRLNPPLYAQFDNGMCYGFLVGTPLSVEDFRDPAIMRKIVKPLVQMHSLELPVSFQNREPQVWYKSDQWMRVVPSKFDDPEKQRKFVEKIGSVDDLKREMAEIRAVLKASKSPVLLCHNDLCSGNIIYKKDKDQVGFIDLEYAGPNYLAYEIADHFCEFAGVHEVDFARYPNETTQKVWIKAYLEESKGGSIVTDDEIHELYRDVNKFALACHLFWTVWGLFQAQNSNIDFDYIEYADLRYSEYKKKKDLFLAL